MSTGSEIAVIGMSGRFPGADNTDAFWDNLKNGMESVTFFTKEELLAAGEEPGRLEDPHYVMANAILEDKDCFDGSFFGYIPSEINLMDPQVRLFHEECWKALEDAGYGAPDPKSKIGLFAGATSNVNWEVYATLINREEVIDDFSASQLRDAKYLSTRISYTLNLSGPSVFIHTACSTSLVAIHQACNSLLLGECSMALAGGVSICGKSKSGYFYREGMINSQDGHCRAFDKEAKGTIVGEGSAVVVLKKYKDALKDGDHIYAIIKGSCVNNDGNHKVGYTAPSIDGQALAIMTAQKWARTAPDSISYIETHGTGTSLGDPIEIAGLTKAFQSDKKQFCAIGSVKTNIGHLDTAAGVAGFIKTVLALKHRQLPPSLHFTTPNPKIDFANSPFYVNTALKDWTNNGHLLRAGVSSFGIGGTNAHVILEEAPALPDSSPGRDHQLLLFSAKTPGALQRNINRFCTWWQQHPEEKLADIAYTLQTGRASFQYRQMLVCRKGENVMEQSGTLQSPDHFHHLSNQLTPQVVFMFSGQGSQYADMCCGLYEQEPVFREQMDYCCRVIADQYGKDLLSIIFSPTDTAAIDNTEYTQPALFIIEYSLARLLMSWGIRPDRMIGHSIGEYVAACISGVFSLDDALKLVVKRGELMQQVQPGKMLSVAATEEAVTGLLENHPALSLAAVNSSALCAVSGDAAAIAAFKATAEQAGFVCKPIRTSHAFHSAMMDEILGDYEQVVASVKLQAPQLPFISNVTGAVAEAALVTQSRYWVDHLRQPVQFAAGITTLFKNRESIFIEVGPGKVLSTLVQVHNLRQESHGVVSLVRQSKESGDDVYHLLQGLGALWLQGITINWTAFYAGERRHKISLPAYSFEKTRYPTDVSAAKLIAGEQSKWGASRSIRDSIHMSNWQRALLPNKAEELAQQGINFLVFSGAEKFSREIIAQLMQLNKEVIEVKNEDGFRILINDNEIIRCTDIDEVWQWLKSQGLIIHHILYCNALEDKAGTAGYEHMGDVLQKGYLGLCRLARLLSSEKHAEKIQVTVIGNHLMQVLEEDEANPLKATLLSVVKIMPLELLQVTCKAVDIPYPFEKPAEERNYATKLLNELFYDSGEPVIAYRYGQRWTPSYSLLQDNQQLTSGVEIVKDGIYIITGGFGGMGLTIGSHLSVQYGAKLVLVHRSLFPPRKDWDKWIETKGKEDTISSQIEKIRTIEEAGGVVDIYQADVSDEKQVRDFCDYVKEQYSRVNGIIWAAGEVDHGGIIQNRDEAGLMKYLGSKVNGVLLFEKYLDLKTLDFLALFSSVGNTFYQSKFGQVAYNAANEFMESYAHYTRRRKGIHAFTISWCDWLNVGMTVKTLQRQSGNKPVSAINAQITDAIYPTEGVSAFYACLQSKAAATIIYKGNLAEAVRDTAIKYKEAIAKLKTTPTDTEEEAVATGSREERLVRLFSDFFGNKDLKAEHDFFELGGDSLKAMTIIGRINQKMGSSLSIADLYKYPTAAALATLLGNNDAAEAHQAIARAPHKEHYTLSSAQKRMYLLQQMDPGGIAYNEFQLVRLEGVLDIDRLENTFHQLIERHESLRTSFIMSEDGPRQVIGRTGRFTIERLGTNKNNINSILREFIRPFDLSEAPLLRVGLIELSAKEHILAVDMHHIIADGVSKGLLIRDFMSLYQGETLPALSLQYKDYAEWQQSPEEQERIVKQQAFWLQEFAGEVPSLELPLDHARPIMKSSKGDHVGFSLSAEQVNLLNQIAVSEKASLFMVMLSAWYVLLAKLGNQEDIVVGITAAGRRHADLEGIIGMFVNTLPVRNRPVGSLSFKDFLAAVKQQSLAALENQDYPYEDLIEALQVARDTSRNPLFDVMLSYQNYEEPSFELPGLTISSYEGEHRVAKFDLKLDIRETDKELLLRFEYCTALFRRETIERFALYLEQIVNAITKDIHGKLSDINILSDPERHQLLHEFNNTQTGYPRDKTIVDLFEEQVARTPRKAAVIYEGQSISYRQLQEQSDKVAAWLRDTGGVTTGDLVGLMLQRGEYLIPVIFGILKAGAAYVPIDPYYPEARIHSVIEDARLKVLLTTSNLKQLTSVPDLTVINLDEQWNNLLQQPVNEFTSTARPHDLAYVIYTSGSTGKPKGVMIEHHSVLNRIAWMQKQYPIGQKDVLLQKTPVVFDVSVWELFWWSFTGASLCLLKPQGEKEPEAIIEAIEKNKVTTIHFVPSMLGAFLSVLNAGFDFTALASLRQVFASGEALKAGHVDLFERSLYKYAGTRLINLYGPTEATVDVSYYECSFHPDGMSVPIGKPIDNIRLHILDRNNRVVPIGIPGELFIAGVGLARGYLNNEQLTNDRFIAGPYVGEDRIYRTGDLARWLPDGNIEYLGRIDQQVKLRGYRIEMEEIAFQLKQYGHITESVVVVREKEGDKYLVAYYVSGQVLESTALKAFLLQQLPDYMVPAFFVWLPQLPLTTNGKLDRKALPEPDTSFNRQYVAPSNETEEKLVELWAEVLKMDKEKISVNVNFFDLGGDSLKILRLAPLINKTLQVNIPVAELFHYSTISSQVSLIHEGGMDMEKQKLIIENELTGMDQALSILAGN